jgi:diaminopimelate decarboxylase
VEYWPARAKGMIELIDKIGIVPERIDIGGGLYGKMPESLKQQFSSEIPDYSAYAKAAATVFAEYFKDAKVKPELLIEPGSALVGDCMKFVGTVKTIKNVRGKYIASVLGSQKNISMSGINPPMEVIHMGGEETEYTDLDIVGFTCIEGDVLYKNYCGKLAKNDAIVISNCGSYSLVMKPPFILPNFPVLDICSGKAEVIKRGETFDDIFHTFCI